MTVHSTCGKVTPGIGCMPRSAHSPSGFFRPSPTSSATAAAAYAHASSRAINTGRIGFGSARGTVVAAVAPAWPGRLSWQQQRYISAARAQQLQAAANGSGSASGRSPTQPRPAAAAGSKLRAAMFGAGAPSGSGRAAPPQPGRGPSHLVHVTDYEAAALDEGVLRMESRAELTAEQVKKASRPELTPLPFLLPSPSAPCPPR